MDETLYTALYSLNFLCRGNQPMALFSSLFKRNTLFFPGCVGKCLLKDVANSYIKVLDKIKLNYVILKEEEVCCGGPALNAGYKQVFEDLRTKNITLFKKHKVSTIITPDPGCYTFLKEFYPEFTVEHISEVLLRYLEFLPMKHGEKITYFDPCYLVNHSHIAEEPLNLLHALGYEVVTLDEQNLCCGASGNLKANLPLVANKMARNVLLRCKTPKLITSCAMCYLHLKSNSQHVEVLELSQVLL